MRTGILIIVLSGLSILGVAITQIFWVENAYRVKKTQFSEKTQVGLKSIVNNLYTLKSKTEPVQKCSKSVCNTLVDFKNNSKDLSLLDSLFKSEFNSIAPEKDYVYGIYKGSRNGLEMVASLDTLYKNEIINSDLKVSLSCLYDHKVSYVLAVYFINENHIIYKQMLNVFIISIILLLIIGGSFIYIIYISFKQKQLSVIKTDFVNNMTHEFKTPISTVSLTSEMLLRDDVISKPELAKKYAKVIYEENQRLKLQVDQVLQVAVIDKGEIKIRKGDIDTHKVISDLINKIQISLTERDGVIESQLNAKYPKIWADKMHFTNIISNLLDNANKYTLNSPLITVSTKNTSKGIIISVQDNGIGIKKENQKHIFRQFYRVHTGNIHDVKGFGLGLYYVKLMVESHGGYVKLESEWEKGCKFSVFFPFNDEPSLTNYVTQSKND